MKLRPIQLVCFALLLSTLSLADSSALAQGAVPLRATYLGALLFPGYESESSLPKRAKPVAASRKIFVRNTSAPLASAAVAALQTVWAMRPPSAHTVALQSVTGFGRRSA